MGCQKDCVIFGVWMECSEALRTILFISFNLVVFNKGTNLLYVSVLLFATGGT